MEQHLCLKKIHDVCKENKYSSKEKNGPLIDLRELKRSNAKINEKQIEGKFHIINGNLNLLGWVVLKSNILVAYKYHIALAKTSIVKPGKHWTKLVNTDDKRSILFPDDYYGNRFQNTEFLFFN